MTLTSQEVGLLAQRALCFEALADKSDCTTRYVDLPGRPLEGFIAAAINIGPTVVRFAEDWLSGQETRLFHRFTEALQASNEHKSAKFVNFGLLEVLFPAIAARLTCDDPEKVVDKMIELMRAAPASDAKAMVEARELAWSTSEKAEQKLADLTDEVRNATSPHDFYDKIFKTTAANSASHQWIANYTAGMPLLREQFASMQASSVPLLDKIKQAYEPIHAAHPDVRIGILADMSAAAIFLHLSFNQQV